MTAAETIPLPAAADGPAARLLTVPEVADLLQEPVRAVKRYIEAGALAHVRLQSGVRIHPQDLAAFVTARTVRAWSRPAMT